MLTKVNSFALLSLLLICLISNKALAQTNCTEAIKLVNKNPLKSYQLCPNSEQILYVYIIDLISKNELSKAELILENKKESRITNLAKANLLIERNKPEEAKNVLSNIMSKDSKDDRAISLLGTLEFNNKNYRASEGLYKQAIEINNSRAESYYNLALSLEMQNRLEEAKIALESALVKEKSGDSNEMKSSLSSSLCRVLIKQNKFDKAKEVVSESTDNKNEKLLYCHGLIKLKENKNEEAIELFKKSIAIKKDINVLLSKLLTEIRLKKSNSFDTLVKLFNTNSKNTEILKAFLWAVAFSENETYFSSFDSHLDVIQKDSSALNNLAIIKSLAGDNRSAKKYLEMSLELNPDNVEAKKNLGDL